MDREVVKELIQEELNVKNLTRELNQLLNNEQVKLKLQTDYTELKEKLGQSGASERAAKIIVDFTKLNKQAATDFSPDELCYSDVNPPK